MKGLSIFILFSVLFSASAIRLNHNVQECQCECDMDIPNPYTETYLSDLYDRDLHKDDHSKFKGLEKHAKNLELNVQSYSQDCEGRKAFRKLLGEGLTLSHFGMDFTKVYQRRHCAGQCKGIDGHEFEKDKDIKLLWDLYYSTKVSSWIRNNDLPEMFRSIFSYTDAYGFTKKEKALFDAFRRDGFVLIDQWSDLDYNAHVKEAERRLLKYSIEPSASESHDIVHNGTLLIKQLSDMGRMTTLDSFRDTSSLMMRLASAYLGDEAEAHDASAFTLKGTATKESYSNGPFHHDGCGRRLKAWIYHDDITMSKHPTLVTAGTNHFQWYESTEYFVGREGLNKLNEDTVRKEFGDRITPMLGRKGGGFLFDTNCIHGAVMKGTHTDRRTTLVEISTKTHMTLPRSRGREDQFMSGWTHKLCPAIGDR